jgi:hypothetical protein
MLDVDSVLKAAVEEIGQSLNLAKVQIRLGHEELDTETTSASGSFSHFDR